MIEALMGVPGKLKKLLDRVTVARASNLDNLDASISSRASGSTAISSAILTSSRIANLDNLDGAISGLPQATARSVQNGTFKGAALNQSGSSTENETSFRDVTISTVQNTNKCILFVTGSISSSSNLIASFNHTTDVQYIPFGRITSTTNIRIGTAKGSTNYFTGRWTLVEYY
jgi:hypothetical protein